MKITIYQKEASFNTIFWREIEIECRGTGTKEDPVIIDPSRDIPQNSYLRDYNFYIHIKNLHQKYLSLTRCQNITLKDCQLKYCHVLNCSDIRIENLSITKLLRLYSSNDIYIQDSNIGKLKLNQSNSNTFKNCSFKKVNKTMSSDNIFESGEISGKQVIEVKQRRVLDSIKKWNIQFLLFFIIIYIAFMIVMPNIIGYKIPIHLHFIAIVICIFLFYLISQIK